MENWVVTLGSFKQLNWKFEKKRADKRVYSFDVLVQDAEGVCKMVLFGVIVHSSGIFSPQKGSGAGKYYPVLELPAELAEKIWFKLRANPLTDNLVPDSMEEAIKNIIIRESTIAKFNVSKEEYDLSDIDPEELLERANGIYRQCHKLPPPPGWVG